MCQSLLTLSLIFQVRLLVYITLYHKHLIEGQYYHYMKRDYLVYWDEVHTPTRSSQLICQTQTRRLSPRLWAPSVWYKGVTCRRNPSLTCRRNPSSHALNEADYEAATVCFCCRRMSRMSLNGYQHWDGPVDIWSYFVCRGMSRIGSSWACVAYVLK